MIRIAQQNDWVVFIIIGCIVLYIFMLFYLQRDSNVKEFLMQKFPDSSNNYLSWIITSCVFVVVLSTFLSQFIPIVPKKITDIQLFGYELNKFGFTFLAVSCFYFLKNIVTYVFYAGTGSNKKWSRFYFVSTKYYFCFSVVLMVLCFVNAYYNIDQLKFVGYCGVGFLLAFVFKQAYYLFHPNRILPENWYYKILYICTLQIIPVLVLWKVLFF